MNVAIAPARPTNARPITPLRAPGSRAEAGESGPGGDQIVVEAYRPAWPGQFRVEAEVLRTALSNLAPRVEHVGSTAVAGLPARPTVDILLGVLRPADIDAHTSRLRNFGYAPAPHSDNDGEQRRFLARTVRGALTHHVHVVEAFSHTWHRLLLFRDLLRIDPQLVSEYAALKRSLAARYAKNRIAYTAGKTAFIQAVLGLPSA